MHCSSIEWQIEYEREHEMSDETSWLRATRHCEYRQHSGYEWLRAEYTYQYGYSVSMKQNTRSRIHVWATSWLRWRDLVITDNTVATGNTVTTDNTKQNTSIWLTSSRIQRAEYTYERHRDYRWCNTVSTSDMMTIDDMKQNTHVCMKTDHNRYIVCRLKNRMSLCCV